MLSNDQRNLLADTLLLYAEGVEEVLRDDEFLAPPAERRDSFPVVEDYEADADRIRRGEKPLHQHTREALTEDDAAPALADDPAAIRELAERLYADFEADTRALQNMISDMEADGLL